MTLRSCGAPSGHVELAGEVGNAGPESQAGEVPLCAARWKGLLLSDYNLWVKDCGDRSQMRIAVWRSASGGVE